jgi:glyoxylase-like metal-dependent hydrolase (beta-lactamase superfamily II)
MRLPSGRKETKTLKGQMKFIWEKLFAVVALSFFIAGIGSLANAIVVTWPGPQKVEIADGIYQFISPDVGADVDGNSIAVVTDHDVLVFDSNVLPATAHNVLTEIRKITSKPVRYVVNSHWHPDHWDGNEMYAKEFPDLEIIANEDTRRLMEQTMKVYVKTLEHQSADADKEIDNDLKTGKNSDGTPLSDKDRKDLQDQLRMEHDFMSEYRAMHPVLPTLTYGDKLTLYHGGREFRIMHFVGNTLGDSALYLPKEKVLLTGDLLVYPVPYCADSHPTAWIESLKTLSRLDANVIVPGHGQAQHDMAYLNLVIDSLQSVVDQVHEALRRGMTLEETKKFVNLDPIRLKFTHDDPEQNANFLGNFSPIVRDAYDEATEELELYQ